MQMEGLSVEDEGEGVSFNVFVYNVQPGITIDYATGESALSGEESGTTSGNEEVRYVLNTSSKKFHKPDCSSVSSISAENREDYTGTRAALMEEGYEPCGNCKP